MWLQLPVQAHEGAEGLGILRKVFREPILKTCLSHSVTHGRQVLNRGCQQQRESVYSPAFWPQNVTNCLNVFITNDYHDHISVILCTSCMPTSHASESSTLHVYKTLLVFSPLST